jgi:hypothetical protein
VSAHTAQALASDELAMECRRLFSYDPITGAITTRVPRGRWLQIPKGSIATSSSGEKCYLAVSVRINGKNVHAPAHRVAWMLVHGRWPIEYIDHINGERTDNRIANLRECTNAENQQNQRRPHKDGANPHIGVCWHKYTRRWRAYIKLDGRNRDIGYFQRVDDAIAARRKAQLEHYPFQTLVAVGEGA